MDNESCKVSESDILNSTVPETLSKTFDSSIEIMNSTEIMMDKNSYKTEKKNS